MSARAVKPERTTLVADRPTAFERTRLLHCVGRIIIHLLLI